jgi:hypothetical protein
MAYSKLTPNDLRNCAVLNFSDRKERVFTQLTMLNLDFDVLVLQIERQVLSHITRRVISTSNAFVLSNRHYMSLGVAYSPLCASLLELEKFAKDNHVDILYDHLFGENSINAACD